MKVLRGQEAGLESSNSFYKGNKSYHTVLPRNPLKSKKIYENL